MIAWLALACIVPAVPPTVSTSSTAPEVDPDDPPNPFTQDGDAKDPTQRPPPDVIEPGYSRFSAFLDQDALLFPLDEDRNYTMGVGFQAAGHWVVDAYLDRPLRGLNALLGLNDVFRTAFVDTTHEDRTGAEAHAFTFAVGAFTPNFLSTSLPLNTDRPYSSIVSVSVAKTAINAEGNLALATELTLGILGLRLAEVVQKGLHEALHATIPRGWPNQISDGGEPTARYAATLKYRTLHTPYLDAAVEGQASAGYYTNLAVGGALRTGRLRSSFASLNANPLSAVNQALEPNDPQSTASEWEVFVFASGRIRTVIYNALLEGQFKDSILTLDRSQVEPFVFEFEGGIKFGQENFRLSLGLSGRTSEIRLPESRTHLWVSIGLDILR